jgi:hypothetical protein
MQRKKILIQIRLRRHEVQNEKERVMAGLPIVPLSEFNWRGNVVRCAECNRTFAENEGVVYFEDGCCCETCAEQRVKIAEQEAKEFAEENCKITKVLPKFNPAREFSCTPEEYEAGNRESYTRSSHLCHCRHNCTNYDDLINGLDPHDLVHAIFYEAVRSRIEGLLTDQIESDGDEENEDNSDEIQ